MRRLIALFALLVAAPAGAETACPEHFAMGREPRVLRAAMLAETQALCFRAFAVLHSGVTRTGLYAAERLTAESVAQARAVPRRNAFHAERRLPREQRAELADYDHSGFDRGHLAPSGDMPDEEADRESFSLANMTPQAPSVNRGVWAGIEAAVLAEAARRGTLHVVTGAAFAATELASVGNVLVPTHLWKAIYDPMRLQGGAYLVENVEGARWRQISLVELARLGGIEPFPGRVVRAMRLPRP